MAMTIATALGVFMFFSSALVLQRGGNLGDAVLWSITIAGGLSYRQRRYFMLFVLLGPTAQVSDCISDAGARPIE
jgi:hypothetical protein